MSYSQGTKTSLAGTAQSTKSDATSKTRPMIHKPTPIKPTFSAPKTTHFIIILVLFALLFAAVLLVNTVVNEIPN